MNGHEVLMLCLNSVRMEQKTTDTDKILYFGLDRLQIDNNYEADPLFQVLLKPVCISSDKAHNHWTMEGDVDPYFQFYLH